MKEAIIVCGLCDKSFINYRLFRDHCQEHGNENVTIKCALCGPTAKCLKNIESMKCHHKYVHKLSAKKCPECGKIVGVKNFNKHIKKVHERQIKFECPVCRKVFYTPSGLNDHMEKHFPEKMIYETCPICNKSIRQSYLERHLKYHQKEETFMCEVCGLLMRNRGNFVAHQETHNTQRSIHLCEICGKNLKTDRCLKVHYNVHSGFAKVKCGVCGSYLSTMHALKTHMLIHLDERPYKCRFCDKGFRNSGNLKVHERIHTGERPYHCKICPSAFYGSANLNKHVRKVHLNGKTSNKKFKCRPNHAICDEE